MMIHVHQFARGVPIEESLAGTVQVSVGTRVRVSRRARPVKMPGKAPQLGRGGTRAIGASTGSHVRRSTVSLTSGTSRTRGQRPRRACIGSRYRA